MFTDYGKHFIYDCFKFFNRDIGKGSFISIKLSSYSSSLLMLHDTVHNVIYVNSLNSPFLQELTQISPKPSEGSRPCQLTQNFLFLNVLFTNPLVITSFFFVTNKVTHFMILTYTRVDRARILYDPRVIYKQISYLLSYLLYITLFTRSSLKFLGHLLSICGN